MFDHVPHPTNLWNVQPKWHVVQKHHQCKASVKKTILTFKMTQYRLQLPSIHGPSKVGGPLDQWSGLAADATESEERLLLMGSVLAPGCFLYFLPFREAGHFFLLRWMICQKMDMCWIRMDLTIASGGCHYKLWSHMNGKYCVISPAKASQQVFGVRDATKTVQKKLLKDHSSKTYHH